MTENDYLIAWSLYAFAAAGCLLVCMLMTRWMWRYLREPLVVLAAVVLFTPTIIDPAQSKYAPAVAITALDLLFKVGSNVWRAVLDLTMYGLIALGVYVLFALIRWPLEKRWKARHPQATAEPAAIAPETDDEPFRDGPVRKPGAPVNANAGARTRVEPRL